MKNLKKLIEWAKTKEGKDLLKKTAINQTKDFYGMVKFGLISTAFVIGIMGSSSYLSKIKKTENSYQNFTKIDEKGNCIKYVPRAGYFYCKTNKPYK